MIALVFAASLQTAPAVITQAVGTYRQARYVRLQMNVNGYGIAGTGSMLFDRQTGRYRERLNIGPQTLYQGFDGVRAWQADAAGTLAVQGNSVGRGTVLAWGDLFAFPRAGHARGTTVRYDGVPQSARVMLDPVARRVTRFTLSNGEFDEVATFGGYRTFDRGITAPQSIRFTDDNGTWRGRVTGVETPDATDADFAPPARANDSFIAGGMTSVPFMVATEIVIPVRIDDGPVMHFILDTGGQNILTATAVKRLRLHPIGAGTVGGAGAGLISTRFLTVRRMRIGSAELRNQPFLVLDSSLLRRIDGIVGYELLSRFAARVDYRTNTLWLASRLPGAWVEGIPASPFVFQSRQPQVDGSIDGIAGTITIDTGNSGILDLNSPFARTHDLWKRYHAATPSLSSLAGVGGRVLDSQIVVRRLRMGTASVEHVHASLTSASAGFEANPSIAANAGEGVFRNFTLVFDYAHQRMYFAPGGIADMSGVVLDRKGDRIVVTGIRTRRARAAGVRVGMVLTELDGKNVSGADIERVRAELTNRELGAIVHMTFDGKKHVALPLFDYL